MEGAGTASLAWPCATGTTVSWSGAERLGRHAREPLRLEGDQAGRAGRAPRWCHGERVERPARESCDKELRG